MPFKPGIRTSTITHVGPRCGSRLRKSDADAKISLLYRAERSSRVRPFRTDGSSSIANARLFGGIIKFWCSLEEYSETARRRHPHFRPLLARRVIQGLS